MFAPLSAANVLAGKIEKKHNNLNAIRLLLALLVLYAHCYPLAVPNTGSVAGALAVDLFFFLSGLLITGSWLRSKSMNDYLRKRVLRIYPGYIVALAFATIAMTLANPSGLLRRVLSWEGLKMAVQDAALLTQTSTSGPQVFPNNPFPGYADGSMWTIPLEFGCYLVVCAIGLFCLFRFRWLVLGGFLYIYLVFCKAIFLHWEHSHMYRRFLVYFFAGVCAWLWRDKIPMRWSLVFISLALIVSMHFTRFSWELVEPFALTYIVLFLGYMKPMKFTQWCDSADLSYGVYLYAWPVQQLVATTAWGRNPWVMLMVATPITIAVAFGSWHLVEKRFLNLKSARFVDRDQALGPTDIQLKEAF
jgi:peptidoglycan/LPS O-acetylase OafA/YrhL